MHCGSPYIRWNTLRTKNSPGVPQRPRKAVFEGPSSTSTRSAKVGQAPVCSNRQSPPNHPTQTAPKVPSSHPVSSVAQRPARSFGQPTPGPMPKLRSSSHCPGQKSVPNSAPAARPRRVCSTRVCVINHLAIGGPWRAQRSSDIHSRAAMDPQKAVRVAAGAEAVFGRKRPDTRVSPGTASKRRCLPSGAVPLPQGPPPQGPLPPSSRRNEISQPEEAQKREPPPVA